MPIGMPRCLQVYRQLCKGPASAKQVAAALGFSEGVTRCYTQALHQCGLIRPTGMERDEDKTGRNRVVWTAEVPSGMVHANGPVTIEHRAFNPSVSRV